MKFRLKLPIQRWYKVEYQDTYYDFGATRLDVPQIYRYTGKVKILSYFQNGRPYIDGQIWYYCELGNPNPRQPKFITFPAHAFKGEWVEEDLL